MYDKTNIADIVDPFTTQYDTVGKHDLGMIMKETSQNMRKIIDTNTRG